MMLFGVNFAVSLWLQLEEQWMETGESTEGWILIGEARDNGWE